MKTKKAFTIVETLVAVFILTLAISATLGATQTGLQSSFYARDQITAYYLAEEAIEEIRNIRDSNFVASPNCSWLNNDNTSQSGCVSIPAACIRQAASPAVSCSVDVASDLRAIAIAPCSGSSCVLKYSNTIGYNMTTGTNSLFSRSVDISQVSDHEAIVTASVSWKSGALTNRAVSLKTVLFNWNSQ